MHYGRSLHQRPRRSLKGMYSTHWKEVLFSIESHGKEVLRLVRLALHLRANEIRYNEMSAKAITEKRRASGKVASNVTLKKACLNFEEG